MFALKNYPKSYGNIRRNFYRLKSFQKSGADIKKIESKLWEFISSTASSSQPKKHFRSYRFIDAGWEWSVFRKNKLMVVKIPSGIFKEVSDRRYLDNTKFAYKKILKYFPGKFVAKTTFLDLDGTNAMEQEYITGQNNEEINYDVKNLELLKNIKKFLGQALIMLDDYQWLPDFDIKRLPRGFRLRNVIFESNIPKIIDFTAYYDVYRLYPQRTAKEVGIKKNRIINFLDWINKKLRT